MFACGDKGTDGPKNEIKEGTYVGTVIADLNDGTPVYTINDVNVELTSNENGTVDVKMLDVKFAEAMPVSINITAPGITATKTEEGHAFSGKDIIPLVMGGPNKDYMITSLSGTLIGETLSFEMTSKGYSLTYTGTSKTE